MPPQGSFLQLKPLQDISLLINPGEAQGSQKCVLSRYQCKGLPFKENFVLCFCSYCLESSLNRTKTKGKVLVCRHAESSTDSKLAKSEVVKEAGGVGMILIDETDQDIAIPFVLPSAIVGRIMGEKILLYVNSTRFVLQLGSDRNFSEIYLPLCWSLIQHYVVLTREPTSRIFQAKTVLGGQPAPRVAAFSSKGPNALTSEILKVIISVIDDQLPTTVYKSKRNL